MLFEMPSGILPSFALMLQESRAVATFAKPQGPL